MILNVIAEKLKPRAKDDFNRRHLEVWLIVQQRLGNCHIR